MTHWHRSMPFGADHGYEWDEHWEYRPPGNAVSSFDVRVRAGKPFDVLKLKSVDLGEVRDYADFLTRTAQRLYGAGADIQRLSNCPICYASLDDAAVELTVFDTPYVRCAGCGHATVRAAPPPDVLDKVFAESETHSSAYIDRTAIEIRMQQIVAPKLDWCIEHFVAHRGRAPRSVLDVGAGGGHFLAGAKRRGMSVEGFEKSKASRAFAHDAFGLALRADDFLAVGAASADVITFWGLLEYVSRPREFIAAARRTLAPDGILVVEVPRVDSLGTLVQALDGAVVARHMDPTSHVSAFTDASLCTALVEEGFAPFAAWYFGMDAYETCMQMALRLDDASVFPALAQFIPAIQKAADRGRQCDDIIIAASLLDP